MHRIFSLCFQLFSSGQKYEEENIHYPPYDAHKFTTVGLKLSYSY